MTTSCVSVFAQRPFWGPGGDSSLVVASDALTMYAVAPSTSKLADLKERGVLTDEEFEHAKAKVLA
jgi:hypothetical protein